MKKNKTLRFFVALLIVLVFLAGLVVGGYFILDKTVVPRYFGMYGIHNMGELVQMMGTLYNSNNETDIVTNGFSSADLASAEDKLIAVGFPKLESTGRLNYSEIGEGHVAPTPESSTQLTDKELASVLGEMLKSGVMAEKLPDLKYLNTLSFTMLETIIKPTKIDGVVDPDSANVVFTLKLDTSSVREQMAAEMEMPLFLLNMIVPKKLFINVNFNVSIVDGEWVYSNSKIAINGRTSKQSEILLNLLISFIYPKDEEMTIEKINQQFGDLVKKGLGLLGEAKFSSTVSGNKNGIILTFK